jgi:transketolase
MSAPSPTVTDTALTRLDPPSLRRLSTTELIKTAARLRLDILEMIHEPQSGHPGSSLSCIDLLVNLWFSYLVWDPTDADWPLRDRFIMSKGHGAPAYYATLMEAGYIPYSEKNTLRKIHSKLQGHPASRYITGCDVSTGSLGHGLSVGVGMALGLRLDHIDSRVVVLLGDGECQEGNVWEAVLSAAHHKTNRLIAIIDRNRLQIDGNTESVKSLGELAPKFAAFGWNTLEIDGHDHAQIGSALKEADRLAAETTAPTAIIANTIKGRGVSFMENQAGWHGKATNEEQYAAARAELLEAEKRLLSL